MMQGPPLAGRGKAGLLFAVVWLLDVLPAQGCGGKSESVPQSPPGSAGSGAGAGSGGSAGAGSGGSAGALAGAGGTAGSSGVSGGEPDAGEPRRDLPPRPPWTPRIPLGAPGWRNSTEPFCSIEVAQLEPHVFSTDEAVYVQVNSRCNTLANDVCNEAGSNLGALSLYRNDGSGWKRIHHRAPPHASFAAQAITGYPDGRLVIGDENCPVFELHPSGASRCLWSGQRDFFPVKTAVSGTVLVVLGGHVEDANVSELWKYDGTAWTQLRVWTGDKPGALAVSGTTAVVAGLNQLWTFDLVSGVGSARSGVPAANYWSAWTYGASDVLLGTGSGGLAHHDGVTWTLSDTKFNDGLYDMWGAPDGSVFTYSQASFGRWKAGAFEAILPGIDDYTLYPSHYIADLWGNSSTEVFLAVNDRDFGAYDCGTLFMVWFDGTTFHQF